MSSASIHPTAIINPAAQIGSGVEIGPFSVVGSGAVIGEGTILQSHVVIEGHVSIANNCLLGGYVCVDDGAFLGGGCVFHQFMHVGRLVIAQGGSAFSKDIPPFLIAAERNCVFGLNIIGLRRAGVSAQDRDEIKTAFKLLYTSGLNISQALDQAALIQFGPLAREFFDFVGGAKQRGICPLKRSNELE